METCEQGKLFEYTFIIYTVYVYSFIHLNIISFDSKAALVYTIIEMYIHMYILVCRTVAYIHIYKYYNCIYVNACM